MVLVRMLGFDDVVLGVAVGVAGEVRPAEEEGAVLVRVANVVGPARGVRAEGPQAATSSRTPRAKAVTLVPRTDVNTVAHLPSPNKLSPQRIVCGARRSARWWRYHAESKVTGSSGTCRFRPVQPLAGCLGLPVLREDHSQPMPRHRGRAWMSSQAGRAGSEQHHPPDGSAVGVVGASCRRWLYRAGCRLHGCRGPVGGGLGGCPDVGLVGGPPVGRDGSLSRCQSDTASADQGVELVLDDVFDPGSLGCVVGLWPQVGFRAGGAPELQGDEVVLLVGAGGGVALVGVARRELRPLKGGRDRRGWPDG